MHIYKERYIFSIESYLCAASYLVKTSNSKLVHDPSNIKHLPYICVTNNAIPGETGCSYPDTRRSYSTCVPEVTYSETGGCIDSMILARLTSNRELCHVVVSVSVRLSPVISLHQCHYCQQYVCYVGGCM